jgi:CheY-like chemotaxis protein/anti-sigma regulatory factor (Ser/Thr protein kinase)
MPTILVVDDSPVDRRIVEGLLEREADLDWLVDYAENGVQALAKMQDLLPDVVVTDLQMPEMDGLELVTAVGTSYPEIPVILIAGHGSEEIAIAALDKGAASYVPKNRLAERLMSTITQVLETAGAEKWLQRVRQCVTERQLELTLDNDVEIIRPVVDCVKGMIEEMDFCDTAERVHVAVALEEALFNAMFHGNLELPRDEVREARSLANHQKFIQTVNKRREESPYCERKAVLRAIFTPHELRFIIRDEGPGFDLAEVPERGDMILDQSCGRGLVLMKNFMDNVTYDREKNELTLIKYPPQEEA